MCRSVCKHFGHQTASRLKLQKKIRTNQSILPSDCPTNIYLSFNKLRSHYVIKTLNVEHDHPFGSMEYDMYSSNRRPTGEMLHQAKVLIDNGANPLLVAEYMNTHGVHDKPRDIYNIKQKLSFRG